MVWHVDTARQNTQDYSYMIEHCRRVADEVDEKDHTVHKKVECSNILHMDLIVCVAEVVVGVVVEVAIVVVGMHIDLPHLAKLNHYSIIHRSQHHPVCSHDYHRPS